ncbi:hypothetical protein F5Y12DRAFT_462181 [Xylaria sp. FL1777]|nr:hypothetical protein F5Y12DRAFT_462181 [Xylaria sp. FL1777]
MGNLGPLTTTFTPINSKACSSIYLATDTDGFWLQRGNASEGCFPPNFTPLDRYYYSPGICQPGYNYACTQLDVSGPGITAATCCPSGFTCRRTRPEDDNDACQSTLGLDSSYIGEVIAYPDGDLSVIGTTSTLIDAGETVYAMGVIVRRAATDPLWSISSTTVDSTATQTGALPTSMESTSKSSVSMLPTMNTTASGGQESGTFSSSTSGAETTGDSAAQTDLSTGTKAAIGVGVILIFFILLAATGAIYYVRRRNGRASLLSRSSQEAGNTEEKPSQQIPRHELEEQVRVHEVNADREPAELTGHWEPVEIG